MKATDIKSGSTRLRALVSVAIVFLTGVVGWWSISNHGMIGAAAPTKHESKRTTATATDSLEQNIPAVIRTEAASSIQQGEQERPTVATYVRFLALNGKPVKAVRVQFLWNQQDDSISYFGESNEEGIARLVDVSPSTPPPRYITITPIHETGVCSSILWDSTSNVDYVIGALVEVSVSIADSISFASIPNASVNVRSLGETDSLGTFASDSHGNARFFVWADKQYGLYVSAPKHDSIELPLVFWNITENDTRRIELKAHLHPIASESAYLVELVGGAELRASHSDDWMIHESETGGKRKATIRDNRMILQLLEKDRIGNHVFLIENQQLRLGAVLLTDGTTCSRLQPKEIRFVPLVTLWAFAEDENGHELHDNVSWEAEVVWRARAECIDLRRIETSETPPMRFVLSTTDDGVQSTILPVAWRQLSVRASPSRGGVGSVELQRDLTIAISGDIDAHVRIPTSMELAIGIRGPDGESVQGAAVACWSLWGELHRTRSRFGFSEGRTGLNGSCRCSISRLGCELEVDAVGFVPVRALLVEPESSTLSVSLAPDGCVSGIVVDGRGTPVPFLTVRGEYSAVPPGSLTNDETQSESLPYSGSLRLGARLIEGYVAWNGLKRGREGRTSWDGSFVLRGLPSTGYVRPYACGLNMIQPEQATVEIGSSGLVLRIIPQVPIAIRRKVPQASRAGREYATIKVLESQDPLQSEGLVLRREIDTWFSLAPGRYLVGRDDRNGQVLPGDLITIVDTSIEVELN